MIWSHVAHLYMESFQRARLSRPPALAKSRAVRTLEEEPSQLPEIRLQHLWQMTDPTGVIQHATFSIPNFHEGYCLDDNARALVLTVLLEELGDDSLEINRAATIYAAFLNYAFDLHTGAFRNFLSFDRKWLDVTGSDDSVGRAAWAVGACIGRTRRRAFHSWAAQLLEPAVNAVAQTTSPRAWAFALIGIHEYLRRMSGDRLMNQHRDIFTTRLVELYEQNASDEWPWFEQNVTYDNAKLPHALILSGRWTNNAHAHWASDCAHCAGSPTCSVRRRGTFVRSAPRDSMFGASKLPSMTSSHWRRSRWFRRPSRRIGPPTIRIGSIRPSWHSSGLRDAMTWGCLCATPVRGHVVMDCTRIA